MLHTCVIRVFFIEFNTQSVWLQHVELSQVTFEMCLILNKKSISKPHFYYTSYRQMNYL